MHIDAQTPLTLCQLTICIYYTIYKRVLLWRAACVQICVCHVVSYYLLRLIPHINNKCYKHTARMMWRVFLLLWWRLLRRAPSSVLITYRKIQTPYIIRPWCNVERCASAVIALQSLNYIYMVFRLIVASAFASLVRDLRLSNLEHPNAKFASISKHRGEPNVCLLSTHIVCDDDSNRVRAEGVQNTLTAGNFVGCVAICV